MRLYRAFSLITVFFAIGFISFFTGCSSGRVFPSPEIFSSIPEADSDSGALEYARWMMKCIESIEADLDRIVPVAEIAARLHVQEGLPIAADGEHGAVSELVGRSGGMMRLKWAYGDRRLSGPGVVLYFMRPGMFNEDIERISLHKGDGSYVIVIGSDELIEDLRSDGVNFDEAFSNHAAPGGGLFKSVTGEYLVPMHKTGNAAVLWTWSGEFLAACTRLGKMPLIYQGFHVTGGLQYAQRHIYVRGFGLEDINFYKETPVPVSPGVAGATFLRHLKEKAGLIVEQELPSIRAVSLEAARRIAGYEKGAVNLFLTGHSILPRGRVYYDPGYFDVINSDWTNLKADVEFSENDLLFYVGFCEIQHYWAAGYKPWVYDARDAGVMHGWSFATFFPSELDEVMPYEYIIDQRWSYGDAVVSFPGLEIKVLPTSGFLAEAILWMTVADVHRRLELDDLEGCPGRLVGRTSLHNAVINNHPAEIKDITGEIGLLNRQDKDGLTPLHVAANLGYGDAATLLLEAGAMTDMRDSYGRTPLHLAAHRGSSEVVRLLLEAKASVSLPDRVGETAIHRAARNGLPDVARYLLQVNPKQIEFKCFKGRTPLHVAAQTGSLDSAVLLLSHGAEINAVDNDGMQPLHFASLESRDAIVEMLLENGAGVNSPDRWGRLPLHWAAGKNNTDIVRELLAAGAEIDRPDIYGRTPVFDAANSSAYDVLELLLKEGADPRVRCKNGRIANDGSTGRAREMLDSYAEGIDQ